jgi:Zn finger protein HypA/HybF involved in hydrogenase expression
MEVYLMKETPEDKAFEQELKGKMGWKCSCSLDIVDKESALKQVTCKSCGKVFKTNRNTEYCFKCERKGH